MLRFLTAVAITAAAASPAVAADFAFSGDGFSNPFTFSIATRPTPDRFNAVSFGVANVETTEAGPFGPLVYDANYTFFNDAGFGGFENGFVAYFSRSLFAGTTAAPIFYNGIFDLADFAGGDPVAMLTITNAEDAPAGVPEPATWAMLVGGIGLVGAALRGRQRMRVAYAA